MNEQLKNILEQQLRDAHAPDAVSWWPLAIGWWLVLALLVSVFAFGLIKLISHRRQNAYRKIAIAELNQTFSLWQEQQNSSRYLQTANSILKRACVHIDKQALSLSGTPWVSHLNGYYENSFSKETEAALTQQLYQPNPNLDIDQIHQEIKAWLVRHKTKLDSNNKELRHA